MLSEPNQSSEPVEEWGEKQLCTSCCFPNDPSAHFCAKCGAPLTPYAAIGPFESVFAQGFVFRQAAERPRSFVVVAGIWIIFSLMLLSGIAVLVYGGDSGYYDTAFGAFLVVVSAVIIWKTTRNYLAWKRVPKKIAD
jgi:hypothetical protein